jgi:tetratricopeptide (TPR) repeat protein
VGRFQESVGLFEKAIAIQADSINYSNLGTSLFYLRQYQAAVSAFEKAVQADSRSEVLMRNLADAYRWTGQKPKAQETYFRAVALGD